MNLLSILTGIPQAAADYFKRRMELKAEERQGEQAIKKALVERQLTLIQEGLHADMQWEMEMAKQAASSWKDEYVLLLVSIPAVLCFFPRGAPYVREGFKAIAEMPNWYQLVFVSVLLATFGIRFWRKSQSDT